MTSSFTDWIKIVCLIYGEMYSAQIKLIKTNTYMGKMNCHFDLLFSSILQVGLSNNI